MAKEKITETPNSPLALGSDSIQPSDAEAAGWTRWLLPAGVAVIILATTIVYWLCRNGDFLWDGGLLITKNPLVKAPDGLYRMWFSFEPVDYWPVTNSMFWLEWHLWGNNTTPYHITNNVLQIASALLIWM